MIKRFTASFTYLFLSVGIALAAAGSPDRAPAGEAVRTRDAKPTGGSSGLVSSNLQIDTKFIESSVGKRFEYVRPDKADGEPNCVAAAMRAGGYLPAFALSGTDDVAETVLPRCFSKRTAGQGTPASGSEPGDLGVLRYTLGSFTTLAHMFLILGNGAIFEKPTPQNRDLFRKARFPSADDMKRTPEFSLEVWQYQPGPKCPLTGINADFAKLPDTHLVKRISAEIDRRIASGDWTTPSGAFTKAELAAYVREHDKRKATWLRSIPGGFKSLRDLGEYMRREFPMNAVKTAQRIPTSQ